MQAYKIDFAGHETITPSGTKFLNTYTQTTKNGRLMLECTGKTNIYDMIQADLEDSKIENIMKRVMMGDLSVLRQSEPQYIDASTVPSNLMEVQNTIVRMKEEFEKFPTEVKKEFNYSAEEYVNEMGSKEFLEKMSPYIEKIEKISMEKNAKEYERKVKEGAKLNYDIERVKKAMEDNSIKEGSEK